MAAVGICGTDLHQLKGEWQRPTPMVLGHEGAGIVEWAGDAVTGLAVGDEVVLSWAPSCGACPDCGRGRPAACVPLHRAIGAGTLVDGTTGLSLDGETVYRGTATGALAERVVVDAKGRAPDARRRTAARGGASRLRGPDRRRRGPVRGARDARLLRPRARRGRGRSVRRSGREDRRSRRHRVGRPVRRTPDAVSAPRGDAQRSPGRARVVPCRPAARRRRLRLRRRRRPVDERDRATVHAEQAAPR